MKKKTNLSGTNLGAGFTIIEVMVSIGILAILFALTTINLTRLPSTTSQSSSYDRLVSDLRSQQTKAMVSYDLAVVPTGGIPYGVYFKNTSYTLFTGSSYSGGTDYYTVDLDPNLTFPGTGITFPDSQVVFAAGSGDIINYTQGKDSVTIMNSLTNEPKILKINKYGATY